ncbi:MAG: 2-ketoisovalerate ferredoxin oxidoreductase [Planctomycetes bacterium RBG_16_59_8]|nr:MAG: 2-ketoisovalerate ferredoxin oxidoreductase [Planctomycetes bacterium RBG_16_59_8]
MAAEYAKPDLAPRKNVEIPSEEIMGMGHLACPGCGCMVALRWALQILGREVYIAAPACCLAVCDGPFPYSSSGVPFLHCAFETAAISASGIRAGLDMLGKTDATVVAWAGDGGTFDIGLQAISGAAERNDDILYVCYDNEAYMNTGVQRSSATPLLTWTTTTPTQAPKDQPKKNLGEIMAAHRIPYFATASLAHYDDFRRKFERAKATRGFRMIHIFSPCPTGWRANENTAIELCRLAVETRIFPLYEVEDGTNYIVNMRPEPKPIGEYLDYQKRFRHLDDAAIARLQQGVNREWERILMKERMTLPSVDR